MPDRSDISPLSITDSKISNEARIAHAKLAKATEGQVLVAQGDGKFAAKTLSGDVTLAADGSTSSSVVATSDGTTVVKGEQGAKGEKGNKGDTGAQGATGPAGSDATVTEATVNAAGAVMHTDIPESDTGFVKRTGAETYDVDTSTYSTTGHGHTLSDITDSGTAAALDVPAAGDAASGEVVKGNDSRLSDDRDPTAHKTSHSLGGSDAIAPSDIGASATGHTHDSRYYTETETDTLLAAKSGTGHTHDSRYFQESEFLNASAGAGDAGKPVKLDADGHIDSSMINSGDVSFVDLDDLPSTFAPSSHDHDHDALTNFVANEHIDWTTDQGATNIHAGNYINTGDTTYTADDGIGLTGTTFSVAAGTGLTQDANGLSLNLQGVAEETVKVDDDYMIFLDGGSTGAGKKESIADFASGLAGSGISALNGNLNLSGWKTFYLDWDDTAGSSPSGKVYYSGSTVVLTHDLGTAYIIISVLDYDDHFGNGTNRYVDMNYSSDVSVEYYTTNAVRLHFNTEPDTSSADKRFKVAILGMPGVSPP